MRLVKLSLVLALLSQSACVIVRPGFVPAAGPAVHGACPPGHVWADGRCHDRGHGHDRDHHDKGHGRD